ncbi:MAG: hypothetical protein HY308_09570 [Gammaproteobacteria bacterium]|nr:hypothetical protein [Gammaproteobacteria bacterium]
MEPLQKPLDVRQPTPWWISLDQARRLRGRWLDRAGLAPRTTPSQTVGTWGNARLLAYQAPHQDQPVLLAVPAPIKAAYIWDLAPAVSVVQRCRAGGVQV